MKIKDNIALSESGFIFDPSTGESYSLNETGGDILTQLKKGSSLDEIKSFLMNKYEVEELEADKEIFDFLNILNQYDLIDKDE